MNSVWLPIVLDNQEVPTASKPCNIKQSEIAGVSLRRAALSGDVELVRVCLEVGAERTSKRTCGLTALYTATLGNNPAVIDLVLDVCGAAEVRSLLLTTSPDGWLPIHIAAKGGKLAAVKSLLFAGDIALRLAQLQARGGKVGGGVTPEEAARYRGHCVLANRLRDQLRSTLAEVARGHSAAADGGPSQAERGMTQAEEDGGASIFAEVISSDAQDTLSSDAQDAQASATHHVPSQAASRSLPDIKRRIVKSLSLASHGRVKTAVRSCSFENIADAVKQSVTAATCQSSAVKETCGQATCSSKSSSAAADTRTLAACAQVVATKHRTRALRLHPLRSIAVTSGDGMTHMTRSLSYDDIGDLEGTTDDTGIGVTGGPSLPSGSGEGGLAALGAAPVARGAPLLAGRAAQVQQLFLVAPEQAEGAAFDPDLVEPLHNTGNILPATLTPLNVSEAPVAQPDHNTILCDACYVRFWAQIVQLCRHKLCAECLNLATPNDACCIAGIS